MIARDWSNVTMAEYDALSIIRREDAAGVLDAYWRRVHREGRLVGDYPEAPTLTDEARDWLTAARLTYMTATDEAELITLAREFVRRFGVLTTSCAARRMVGVR